mmetsp:Transcript_1859/g.4090  ORF Transcript_1859/g.4090 Transcript_1859/m.4090 type:complete len:103 (-) Transcript_1859:44-352(-)
MVDIRRGWAVDDIKEWAACARSDVGEKAMAVDRSSSDASAVAVATVILERELKFISILRVLVFLSGDIEGEWYASKGYRCNYFVLFRSSILWSIQMRAVVGS